MLEEQRPEQEPIEIIIMDEPKEQDRLEIGDITEDQRRAFISLIRNRRGSLGLNQYEVGERAGISQTIVSKAERYGHFNMRATDMFKLLYGYGIPANEVAALLNLLPGERISSERQQRIQQLNTILSNLDDEQFDFVEKSINALSKGL